MDKISTGTHIVKDISDGGVAQGQEGRKVAREQRSEVGGSQ